MGYWGSLMCIVIVHHAEEWEDRAAAARMRAPPRAARRSPARGRAPRPEALTHVEGTVAFHRKPVLTRQATARAVSDNQRVVATTTAAKKLLRGPEGRRRGDHRGRGTDKKKNK